MENWMKKYNIQMITRDSNNVCTVEMYDLINKQTKKSMYKKSVAFMNKKIVK